MFWKRNIKKLSILKVHFFVISLIMLFYTSTVFAENNYTVFNAQQNISTDKVWNIKFSSDIDKNSVNNQNVKVVDENGSPLKLNLSCSGNVVSVKPLTNYNSGKTYTIYVDNINTLNGYNLKNPGTMNFTIKNGVQPSQNSNSYSLVDTHTYKVTDTLTFTADSETKLNVTYNLGSLSDSPYQKELDLKVTGENTQITSGNSSNKKLTANSYLKSGQQLQYQVTRTIQTSGINYTKNLSKTSGDYSTFSDYNKYTAAANKIESDNSAIINKSKDWYLFIILKTLRFHCRILVFSR